ncbi:hypothetical protein BB558_000744 [Smittium angustum]|uniref:PPM-type phosphatase domain-containing protein n=1 Tax=Smittium angustum TaxID=133377 RepID=A0A2U1JDP2_SMIAN|nr:hypothetical protein BB558_000744 [Smittium angustum]
MKPLFGCVSKGITTSALSKLNLSRYFPRSTNKILTTRLLNTGSLANTNSDNIHNKENNSAGAVSTTVDKPKSHPITNFVEKSSTVESVKTSQKPPSDTYPHYVAYTEEGTVRVDIRKSPQLISSQSLRGVREVNQDRVAFRPLRIPGMVTDRRDKGSAQVMYFGVFDGHGGTECSQLLQDTLYKEIEQIQPSELISIVDGYRQLGDSWHDYTPKVLADMIDIYDKEKRFQSFLTLEERLTLAFIKTDMEISLHDWREKMGSTSCVVLMWDSEGLPFWSKDSNVNLMIANCGDCKAILCDTVNGGHARALTRLHRPSLRSEKQRLERYGTMFSIDSYGEERAMSLVANTRAFGDWLVKHFGIIAEPEISHLTVSGNDGAFIVVVSDGVTDVMTDQEIVDVVKNTRTAEVGAKIIAQTAEKLNSLDNISAIVVRLAGWDVPTLVDLTKDFREERIKNNEMIKRFQGGHDTNFSMNSDLNGSGNILLVNPDKLIQRIFGSKGKGKPKPSNTKNTSELSTTTPNLNTHLHPSSLSVKAIRGRLALLKVQLTLRSIGEEIDLGDGMDDTGDVLSINEVVDMTLKVLGKGEGSDQSHNSSSTKNTTSFDFHSKAALTKFDILLTSDELKRAWKLLGLHVIEIT